VYAPPYLPASERVRVAWQRRAESDYFFNFWTALGWTVLTLGVFGLYVIYQLVRRMRDHNARRLELLDAALTVAWEEAERRQLDEELTPSFQRAALHIADLRGLTREFREPILWVILTAVLGILADMVAFILLDQDLVRHDRAEVGVEAELALIYGRLGQSVPTPDPERVKGQHNYVGRVVATFFSGGIYMLWWFNDVMVEPNRHFLTNWVMEDSLATAVQNLQLP
jgi:hypothetical protein